MPYRHPEHPLCATAAEPFCRCPPVWRTAPEPESAPPGFVLFAASFLAVLFGMTIGLPGARAVVWQRTRDQWITETF